MDNLNLNNEVEKSTNLIKRLHEEFDAKVRQDQKELLDLVLQEFMDKLDKDENGNVLNNDRNRRLLQSIEKTFTDFNRTNSVELVKTILVGVYSLIDYNSNYFSMMSGNVTVTKLSKDTKQLVNEWLGIKDGKVAKNGYLDTLINDTTAKKIVQNFANKTVIAQTGYNGAKKELQKIIIGNKETLGALEKYHRNFTYDLYSQVDSSVANEMRQGLGLQYAIYDGDIIDTSRKFCREHIKKVFHISEINAIEITEARPPNYNPIQDRGGYGCRHRWFWISDALARRMRPEVKELFEKKNAKEVDDKKNIEVKNVDDFIEHYDKLIGDKEGNQIGGEHKTLQKIVAESKGLTKKPETITEKEAEKYDRFLYRGFSKKEFADSYDTTEFSGTGIYGNGDYFGANEKIAKDYALEKGAFIKVAIPNDYKTIKYSEARKLTDDFNSEIISKMFKIYKTDPDFAEKIQRNITQFNDVGFYATLMGYDGIDVDRGGEDYHVVLNKSKIKIVR